MADVPAKENEIELSKIPKSVLARLTSIVDLLQRFKEDKIEIDSISQKEFVTAVSPNTILVVKEYSLLPKVLVAEGTKETNALNALLDKSKELLNEIYRAGLSKQAVGFNTAVASYEEFLSATTVEED